MIVYQGPSVIDVAPIVAIATTGSKNRKTGPMTQVWILRSDVAPIQAAYSGEDESICGTCPHRYQPGSGLAPSRPRTCYVDVSRAPQSVFRTYRAGRYRTIDAVTVSRMGPVRIGAYGDPGALPLAIVAALASGAHGHTGYTHRWRERPDLAPYLMASVDSAAERDQAHAAGWRTFRVRAQHAPHLARVGSTVGEIQCVEATRGIQCADCGLCNGAQAGPGVRSVWIAAHGQSAKRVGLRVLQ